MGSELTPEQLNQTGDMIMFFASTLILMMGLLVTAYGKFDDWRYEKFMSSSDEETEHESVPQTHVAELPGVPANRVVLPQNGRNTSLHIAEDAKLEALAQLTLESRRKAFQNGIVPETRAIYAILGIAPSSDMNSDYKRVKRILAAKIAMLQGSDETEFPDLSPSQVATRQRLNLSK